MDDKDEIIAAQAAEIEALRQDVLALTDKLAKVTKALSKEQLRANLLDKSNPLDSTTPQA